jgi:serine/threonine protein kinase/Tol biopolymer transport system component
VPLAPGSKLGSYEVLSLLGAGGMGEVYRARDRRLGREVAIKVLPADRLADEDRRRRFVQEAQAASALNHPHIITIYEIESAEGNDFIVMEYVPGQSLDALIPRHGMRLGEVLRIAIPVASALAAAHGRGIIHRDLKPANVIVGQDGAVKVLDFGLAKLTGDEASSYEQTATNVREVGLSVPGTIVGTAAYMAPEQATGGRVDARSDIFSFGAMLYEMVTGVRAFAGHSTADTLASVVRDQPKPPTALAHGVPSDLEKVILRCLRKDPERRFQHMADVKVALQEIKEDSESGSAAAVVPRDRRRRRLAALAGTLILLAGATAWLLRPRHPAETQPWRVVPLTALKGTETDPSFSPDGGQVAFAWNGEREDNFDIYLKIVGSSELRRLTTNPAPDTSPCWSPKGQQIAFVRGQTVRTVHVVSPLGGTDRKVSDFSVAGRIAWSPDGRWIAAAHDATLPSSRADETGIFLIPVEGGEPRPIVRSQLPTTDFSPAFAPDGRRLAYVSCGYLHCAIYVVELDAAFKPVAAPRQLVKPIFIDISAIFNISSIAWARDGRSVIYSSFEANRLTYLWRVAADGGRTAERIEAAGLGAVGPAMVFARDRLAFARISDDVDLYRFTAGRPPEVVAASSLLEMEASLSADGHRLAFTSARSADALQIWVAAADGSGPQQLTHNARNQGSPSWSPDGRHIAFDSFDDDSHYHIWIMDADGGNRRQVTTDPGDQNVPTWSWDGQWIYFSWDSGNGRDIWRTTLEGGRKERVTRGGSGLLGREAADGNTLLYQQKDGYGDQPLLAAPLSGGPPRQVIACVLPTAFAVAATGIYYLACTRDTNAPIHLMDPETGADRLLGTLEHYYYGALPAILTVSRDGRTILYGRGTKDADLMLIENFR